MVGAVIHRQHHLWPLTSRDYIFLPYKTPQALVRAIPVGHLPPLQLERKLRSQRS